MLLVLVVADDGHVSVAVVEGRKDFRLKAVRRIGDMGVLFEGVGGEIYTPSAPFVAPAR